MLFRSDGFELRAVAAMRRLRRAGNVAAFAEEAAFDGVRRDENISRLGVKMILGGAQESKTFFRNL